MEGIKWDIKVKNRLRKIQREIEKMKPVDCEKLCNDMNAAINDADQAQADAKDATETWQTSETNRKVAIQRVDDGQATLEKNEQSKTDCINKCGGEPDCIGDCNTYWDQEIANSQAALDKYVQEADKATQEEQVAKANMETAEAMQKQADTARQSAMDAVDQGECQCK